MSLRTQKIFRSRNTHALIAAILATLMLLSSGQVVGADVHTGLQYNQQSNQLTGLSQTNLYYGEIEDEAWCVQWDWVQDPLFYDNWIQVCITVHLDHHTSGTYGALYGPSGLNQAHSNESGGPSSGVGFGVGNPQAGQWSASGDHYTVIDVYVCSLHLAWGGGYQLNQCDYGWSLPGYFLGATSAQASVPPPSNSCPISSFDAKAIELSLEWPALLPWERNTGLICAYGVITMINYSDSFHTPWGYPIQPLQDDPCRSNTPILDYQTLPWGGLHNHPIFITVQQYMQGKGCNNWNGRFPGITATFADLGDTMAAGRNWSAEDESIWRCRPNNPGYLRNTDFHVRMLLGGPPPVCSWTENRTVL